MIAGDWLYWLAWLGVAVVYVAMVALAWWALFADRPRGRRRCPKCWYDMSYSPGMKCAECGFAAASERQLGRTRRRYGYAVLAIMTSVVVAVAIHERASHEGWVSMMPTKAIIMAMPLTDKSNGAIFAELRRRFIAEQYSDAELRMVIDRCVTGDWRARPPGQAWADRYGDLLLLWRYEIGRMARREADEDRARTLREIESLMFDVPPRVDVSLRESWPSGTPAFALLHVEEWWPSGTRLRVRATPLNLDAPERVFYQTNFSFARSAFTLPLGPLDEAQSEVQLAVRVERREAESREWEHVWDGRVDIPVRVDGTLAGAIEPVESERHMMAMMDTLAGHVVRWDYGRSPVRFRYRPTHTHGSLFEDVAIGVSVQLSKDGKLLRELHLWWMGGGLPGGELRRNIGWEIVHEDLDAIAAIDPNEGGYEVSVRGLPEIALRVGDAEKYWSGEFVVPAAFINSGGRAPAPDWWTDDREVLEP